MSSPQLPPTSVAAALAGLAADVRADKDDAGMIGAAIGELFARLLTCLARLMARVEAGTLPQSQPRDTTVAIGTPAAPGLLTGLFGWLGGLLPVGGSVAVGFGGGGGGLKPTLRDFGGDAAPPCPRPTRTLGASPGVPVLRHSGIPADGVDGPPPVHMWGVVCHGAATSTSTAGPLFKIGLFRTLLGMSISLLYRNVLAYPGAPVSTARSAASGITAA